MAAVATAEELDDYHMTLARCVPDERSWLYIWDGADFPCPSRARARPVSGDCSGLVLA
jgi:hypothetical protein